MKVVISKQTKKYVASLNMADKNRIAKAIAKLELEPPEGDIDKLEGNKKERAYRLRVGDWRRLYKVKEQKNEDGITENYIAVYKIAPRGQAYKE